MCRIQGDEAIERAGGAVEWGRLLRRLVVGTLLVRFGAVIPFVLAVVGLVLALAVLGVGLLPISPLYRDRAQPPRLA